ncbi:MAG: hypothetical protein EOP07_19825 [Proteobacteria bacterium]|nr:MAG: hypothetical protein EOP07_19825 [Pseudomonadota bacterium]
MKRFENKLLIIIFALFPFFFGCTIKTKSSSNIKAGVNSLEKHILFVKDGNAFTYQNDKEVAVLDNALLPCKYSIQPRTKIEELGGNFTVTQPGGLVLHLTKNGDKGACQNSKAGGFDQLICVKKLSTPGEFSFSVSCMKD